MIEARDVHRHLGGLAGISLDARLGSVTALIGPNGAGKSTLLDVLAGRVRADRGTVQIDDAPLGTLRPAQLARRLAFLPQASEVAFQIRVWDLVALGRSPHQGNADQCDDAAAIEAALRMTDAWALRHRVYQQTSGGERQRAQLARAIAQIWRREADKPRWLLLDEPTASLDPGHRLAVMRLLRDLAQGGIGIVLALHDLNDAARFADHVVLLERGRVIAQGAPDAVLQIAPLSDAYGAQAEIAVARDGRPIILFA